jgi:hypothetical protein
VWREREFKETSFLPLRRHAFNDAGIECEGDVGEREKNRGWGSGRKEVSKV